MPNYVTETENPSPATLSYLSGYFAGSGRVDSDRRRLIARDLSSWGLTGFSRTPNTGVVSHWITGPFLLGLIQALYRNPGESAFRN